MKQSVTFRIGIMLAIALVLSISMMLFVLLSLEESAKIQKSKDSIHELASNVRESVKYMMGEGVTEAAPLIGKLSTSKNILDLSLKAGDAIHAGNSENFDSAEKQAFTTGEAVTQSELFKGEDVYRTIEPIKAEEKCSQCHSVAEGSTLAVVNLRYSMKATNDFVAAQRWRAFAMLLATIAIAFLTIMMFLRKNVISVLQLCVGKIKDVAAAINDLTKNMELLAKGDLEAHVRVKVEKLNISSEDEIGELVTNVNSIINGFDSAVISFKKTRDEIASLIRETNTLTTFAQEGQLEKRSDITKYHGAFRELISGINSSFSEIATPLQHSTKILRALAGGDFTVAMEGEYKGVNLVMKDSINNLALALNDVLSEIKLSSQDTDATANDISRMSSSMVSNARRQKDEIEEVASAIEEMSQTIAGTTHNISNVSKLSMVAVNDAEKGAQKVIASKTGMQQARQLAAEAEEIIGSLVKKTEQIGAITKVIDEISGQTNLLALNAAIEAARAGENGRGFAIVADEVRKLADRTGKATTEIADTVKAIQEEAGKAFDSMRTAGQSVANGMNLTEELNNTLRAMSKTITVVSDEISQLAATAEEQSTTAEQISINMNNIASVTDSFVSGSEKFERAAGELRSLTGNMNQSVGRFNVSDMTEQKSAIIAKK